MAFANHLIKFGQGHFPSYIDFSKCPVIALKTIYRGEDMG